MNKYSLSVLKKWLFRCWSSTVMILLLALLMASSSYGQIVTQGASVQANFGIDADLYSGYQLVSPLSGFISGTDDWFYNPELDNAGGTPVFKPSSSQITDWYNAIIADDNTAFTLRMSEFGHIPRNTKIGSITWIDGVYRRDNNSTQGGADDVFVSDADKNADNPSTWDIGWKSTPQKNDLIEVMGHMRIEEDIDLDGDGKDDVWGIGAFSTISSDGDSHVDFEFFQNQIEIVGSEIQGLGGQGGRTAWEFDDTDGFVESAGALIVSIDFEGGGTEPYAHVRVWISEDDYNTLNSRSDRPFDIIPGDWNMGDESGVYGYAGIEPKDGADSPAAWAIVNVTEPTLAPPWGTLEGSQATYYDYLQPLQFTEFAINMSYLGLDAFGGDDCNKTLGSLFVKSRSSQEFTAALKDYAGPFLFGYEYTTDVSVQDLKTCVTGAESYVINLEDGVVDDFGGNLSFFENAADTSNLGAAIVNPGSFSVDADDMPKTIYVRSTNADDPDQLCYAVDSFVIDYWPIPVCDITPYDASNIYTYDGEAKVNTPDIVSYSWYTTDGLIGGGTTTDSIWGLKGSLDGIEYYVDLEDVNGCTVTCTTTIYAGTYAPPDCTVEVVDATCDGFNDGSAKLQDVPPNWADYDYEWFKLPDEVTVIGTDTMITDLDSGTYKLVITDNNLDVPQSTDCEGTVSDRDPVVLTCPGDYLENACTDATDIKTHFDNWMAGVSVIGSDSMLTTDWDSLTYPDICGDTITVTWTLHDECANPNTCSATFRLPAPDAVTYNQPQDDDVSACLFADQTDADTTFANWVAAQTAAIAVGGGCDPDIEDDAPAGLSAFCAGDTVTVTWTITDLCEGPITVSADYMLSAAPAVTYNQPQDDDVSACLFADQTDADTTFANWVAAQTAAIAVGGGCDPDIEDDAPAGLSAFCAGDTVTVTWTITDLCEGPITVSADYMLSAAPAVTYNQPQDDDVSACLFADQTDADTTFANWVAAQTAAIAVGGGCDPDIEDDAPAGLSAFCAGDTVTVTWTITDLCEGPITVSADYMLSAAPAVTYNQPQDDDVSACLFADQTDADTTFANWVAAQTAAIAVGGGCDPDIEDDAPAGLSAFCAGDTVTVTWTITDLCEGPITVSADYMLSAAPAVTYNQPQDDDVSACLFADQTDADTTFANWVAAQTAAIAVGGGCDPDIEDDAPAGLSAFCAGDTVTVTWTITDLCEGPITVSADYMLSAAPAVTYNQPQDDDVSACLFADQTDADTTFANWVAAQTAAIAVGGGCDPDIEDDAPAGLSAFCAGDTVTVTWTITDLCEGPITVSADYMLSAAPAVTYNQPQDDDVSACLFADQTDADTTFANWVAAQTAAIAVGGGCDPDIEDDAPAGLSAFCAGDTVTVTWTITDLCEGPITVSADYMLSAAPAVTYNQPQDDDVSACLFADQTDADTTFANWVAAQTAAIAVGGGCDPDIEDDAPAGLSAFCAGDTVTVTWTITDLCEGPITVSADYMLSAAPAVTYNQPQDDDVSACLFADQTDADTTFANWVAAQTAAISVGGGCDPDIEDDAPAGLSAFCAGDTVTVTWTITDLCEGPITVSADYMLSAAPAVTYNQPQDDDVSACLFADQTDADTTFANWVAAQTAAIAVGGGCDPDIEDDAPAGLSAFCAGDTVTVTWTITDLCEGPITVSADYMLSAAPAVTWTEPSDSINAMCAFEDQAALDLAFDNWLTYVEGIANVSGGCNPVVTNDATDAPNVCLDDTVTVTWTIEDLCETNYFDAKFIVTGDTVKPVITLPTDYEDYVCDIAVPASLTATWTDNCMDGSMNVVSTRELTVDTTCGQTYTYYFEVQDACGNMAKDSLTISREYVSLEECETAFAKLEDELPDPLEAYDPVNNPDPYGLTDDSTAIGSRCFIDDVFDRWGWVNRIREDSTYYLPVYAGAGQCDIGAGYLVGTAELIFEDGTVTVNFDLDDPWVLTEAHVYAGTGMYPLLTKGKKVDATVAPGQYNLVYENGDPLTGFTLDITDASRYIYVIIHAVTCRPTCVCDGTVFDEMDWGTTATAITNSMSTKVKGPKKVETLDYVEGEFNVFPNPFDEAVNFEFVPAVSGHAVLEIHNMLGQRVVRLLDKPVEAGELQRVEFRPETEISGMYLYRLDINGDTRIGKLIYRNK